MLWNEFLKNVILKPLLMRLGTMGAVALVAGGQWLCSHWNACGLVTENGAQMVATYVVAAALLAFDLAVEFLARVSRKRAEAARAAALVRRDLP